MGKFRETGSTPKFDLYICAGESGLIEAKSIHSNFEKRVKTTLMNLSSSFDSIEEEISSSGMASIHSSYSIILAPNRPPPFSSSLSLCAACVLFLLTSDALHHEKCLFVLKCANEYEKRVIVLHPKDLCAFPRFEEQPLEFRDAVLMEDVIIYTHNKQSVAIKDLDEKLQLVSFSFFLFFLSSFFLFLFFFFSLHLYISLSGLPLAREKA